MSNQAGSFLQGMAGGMGLGMQYKNMQANKKDTSQQQAPTGTQAVQTTAQNSADTTSGVNTAGGVGLTGFGQAQPMQPVQATQPQQGTQTALQTGTSSLWQNILGMIGGGGK